MKLLLKSEVREQVACALIARMQREEFIKRKSERLITVFGKAGE